MRLYIGSSGSELGCSVCFSSCFALSLAVEVGGGMLMFLQPGL